MKMHASCLPKKFLPIIQFLLLAQVFLSCGNEVLDRGQISKLSEESSSWLITPTPGAITEKACKNIFTETYSDPYPTLQMSKCALAIPSSMSIDVCTVDLKNCLDIAQVGYAAGTSANDVIKKEKERVMLELSKLATEAQRLDATHCSPNVSAVTSKTTISKVSFSTNRNQKPEGCDAISVALEIIILAEKGIETASIQEASDTLDMAKDLLSAAGQVLIGASPVGRAIDVYEAITGKSAMPPFGEISKAERVMALIGAVSTGSGSFKAIAKIVKASGKIKDGKDAVVSATKIADKVAPVLKGWRKDHKILDVLDSKAANQPFLDIGWEAPFKNGSNVVKFETRSADKWVRVHGPNNVEGSFLMRKEAIEGMNAKQIQFKYSLPKTPTMVTDVEVPAGTTILRGHVGKTTFSSKDGAIQYHLENKLPTSAFKNTRPISE